MALVGAAIVRRVVRRLRARLIWPEWVWVVRCISHRRYPHPCPCRRNAWFLVGLLSFTKAFGHVTGLCKHSRQFARLDCPKRLKSEGTHMIIAPAFRIVCS